MSTGGPIQDVSIRGRLFAVAADAEGSRKLGGFEQETQMNGDGTGRNVMSRVPWFLNDLQLDCDDTRGDQEFLQEICDLKANVTITATFCNGTTYQGSGTIQGELTWVPKTTLCAVNLGGPGKMTAQ